MPLSENGSDVSMVVMAQTFEYGAELRPLIADALLAPHEDMTEFL